MKFNNYLKDKVLYIIIYIILILLCIGVLYLFNVNLFLLFTIPFFIFISLSFSIIHEYYIKKKFYDLLKNTTKNLDNLMYVCDIIDKPEFLEGKILYDNLYLSNKAYLEKLNEIKLNEKELEKYLELWAHEIKTPISSSKLIIFNNKNKITSSIEDEIDKIELYVEQVMYYARTENAYKDYIIKEVQLESIINEVIKKNKKDCINKKINIEIDLKVTKVSSDSKWLLFIINQIVINSIKYSKDKNAYIKFNTIENKNNIILNIIDNGIGINECDVPRVFDKGFTGINGRDKYNSTGIGLYLVKSLCEKLGNDISLVSTIYEGTTVSIVFPLGKDYKNVMNSNINRY
ncbi:MAG: sensor histidine kinase [Bacilli bacterium]